MMGKSASQAALKAISSIPRREDEAVFAEPWEARAFAMALYLHESGLFTWPQWAERFGAALKANTDAGEPRSYYQVWLAVLEDLVEAKGIADAKERSQRDAEWLAAAARTPHGKAIEL